MVSTIEVGNSARISLSSKPRTNAPTPNAPRNPRIPMLMGNTLAITNIATSAIKGSISMEVMTNFRCGGATGRRYRVAEATPIGRAWLTTR